MKKIKLIFTGLFMVATTMLLTMKEAKSQGLLKEIIYSVGSLYTEVEAGKAALEGDTDKAILLQGISDGIKNTATGNRYNNAAQRVGDNRNNLDYAISDAVDQAIAEMNAARDPNELSDMFTYTSYEPDDNPINDARDFIGLERDVYQEGEKIYMASKNTEVEEMVDANFYIFDSNGEELTKIGARYFPGAIVPLDLSGLGPGKYSFISEIDGNLARKDIIIVPKGQMIIGKIGLYGIQNQLTAYIAFSYGGLIFAKGYVDINEDGEVQAEEFFGAISPEYELEGWLDSKRSYVEIAKSKSPRKAIVFSSSASHLGFNLSTWTGKARKNRRLVWGGESKKKMRERGVKYLIFDIPELQKGNYYAFGQFTNVQEYYIEIK